MPSDNLLPIFQQISDEYDRATSRFAPFNSKHEGYAVILEELDELKEAVFKKGFTPADQYGEALQVATMAIRFMVDCFERA